MKKSIVAVAVFAVALLAQADVLYWMVSDEIAETAAENGTASPFATLYAVCQLAYCFWLVACWFV